MSQKKQKLKNLRNVLVSPFNIKCHKTNSKGAALLQTTLEDLLPLAKLENSRLKMQSNSKTKEKSDHGTNSVKNHNNIFRRYLAPGFQSVIRGVEKKELCCVLLSSDISPPMLSRVVCSYCNTYGIPLIVLSELKTITKSALGFSSMVLGFKKIAESPENKFYPIYEIVSQHPCVFETALVKQKDTALQKEEKSVSQTEASNISSIKSKDLYLYRDKRNERAFRPGTGTNTTLNSRLQSPGKSGMDDNFISFGKSESKPLEAKLLGRNIKESLNKNYDEEDDSDEDSLDEDNIFFVDSKPDHMLLEAEPTSNEEKVPLTSKKHQDKKSETTKKKVKATSERYFSSKIKNYEKAQKIKKKQKDILNQSTSEFLEADSIKRKERFASKFNPLRIKTITSNPKKIRKKKK